MLKKNLLRTSAIAVAIALVASIIGRVAIYKTVPVTKSGNGTEKSKQMISESGIINNEQSLAENLKFKISELWRLSLNSDLDASIKNSVQIINQNYDSKKLADIVKKTEEDFDVVADEYLASLQLGIDFELYINDREVYEQEKGDINYGDELLTVEKIDEYLNELNAKEAEDIVNRTNNEQANLPIIESPNAQPEVPNAESVLPKNPADEIRKEIDEIVSLTFD